jgi:hypothetical protein
MENRMVYKYKTEAVTKLYEEWQLFREAQGVNQELWDVYPANFWTRHRVVMDDFSANNIIPADALVVAIAAVAVEFIFKIDDVSKYHYPATWVAQHLSRGVDDATKTLQKYV